MLRLSNWPIYAPKKRMPEADGEPPLPELTGLPGTLLFTLRARAEEHGRADRLFADPLAADWYERLPQSPSMRQAMTTAYSPIFQLSSAIRTQLYDALAARFLATRQRPWVVELGAGLSTRFARLGAERAHWWELDLPPAIAARRLVDVETAQHRFLPYSLTDGRWVEMVTAVSPADILFIAEGVLFFMAPGDVATLFRLLRRHFPGATFALDVLTEQFSPAARRRFAAQATPMQWLLADEGELVAAGLSIHASHVITQQFPERWRELGFDLAQLQGARGNILLETVIL